MTCLRNWTPPCLRNFILSQAPGGTAPPARLFLPGQSRERVLCRCLSRSEAAKKTEIDNSIQGRMQAGARAQGGRAPQESAAALGSPSLRLRRIGWERRAALFRPAPPFGTQKKGWQRATFPRSNAQYHRRRGPSPSCSEWERVLPPRYGRQPKKGNCTGRGACATLGVEVQWSLPGSYARRRQRRRREKKGGQAARPISTGQLRLSPVLHLRPIYPVISRGPSDSPKRMGDLVFGGAWRLDAFSAYPFAT